MATDTPPIYSGITYNSEFFPDASTTGGFTQAQANALYLRKTVPDTATAVETFNSGLKSNSIDALTSTGNMVINSGTGNTIVGATSGVVYIGNNQVGLGSVINIGSSITETRFAGTIKTQVVNPTTTGGTLSVATGDASNVLALHSTSSRTGAINIGNGASSTGAIKIGDGTQTSNILIGSNNTTPIGTDNVYIGASTKTVNINGTLKFNDNGGSLIMGSSGTSYISLGAMNTTFNIGGTSSIFNMNSPITVGYVPSAITSTSQIGYTVKDSITYTTTISSGVFTNLFTPITLPAGVWLITYSVRFQGGATTFTNTYAIGQKDAEITPPLQIIGFDQPTLSNGLGLTGNFVVVSNGTTTYNVNVVTTYIGGAVTIQSDTSNYGSSVRRTRIA